MKRAIIIGASSGIGKELAILLADNGYKVGITGRRTELLQKIKQTNPDNFYVKTFDATDKNLTKEKLTELTDELGGLDLLVVSSGTGDINEMLNFEIEQKTIDLNVAGFTNIIVWAYKFFEQQSHGHIVAISSIAGLRGSRQAPSYNASKAYQINYLEGLRQKVSRSKSIFVTDIRPGLVDTEMAKGENLFWVMPAKKVAAQIFRAVRNRRKVVYVTRRWGLLARFLKILPRFVYDKM